jgi:4-amino-4-deoxy-L-arabinose transferase-like glycosyltransferase
VLRVGLMLAGFLRTGTDVMTQGDTASYLLPARSLLHGGFTSGGTPEIDRTPGYPIFLMLTGMSHDNVLLAVLAQVAISILSLVLISRIAGRVFHSRTAAIFAVWLYAIEPLSLLSTVRLMPETLFVLLLLCVIDRLLAYLKDSRISALALAGVALAAATYVRPVSYYLVAPLACLLVVAAPRRHGFWWKGPALLLLCTVPWLAAWQVRNRIETGYSGFSSIVEKNLYFYQSAEVIAELQHLSLGAEQMQLGYQQPGVPDEASYLARHPEQQEWSLVQRLGYMRSQSLSVLGQHRLLYLKTHFAGVAVVAFTPCATELLQLLRLYPDQRSMPRRILNEGILGSAVHVLGDNPVVAVAMIILEVLLLLYYAAALRGFTHAGADKTALWLLAGVVLYFLLISGGAQAVGRYRAPVMPVLCVLAGGGLATLLNGKRAASRGPLPIPESTHS